MTHVSLDSQDENVMQFLLNLKLNSNSSILELHGRPVACVVPPPRECGAASETPWADEKNARRFDLIDRKIAGGITAEAATRQHSS